MHVPASGTNKERVTPRPAQDFDELEPVDRGIDGPPDRDRAVSFEEDGAGQRLGWFAKRRGHSRPELCAAGRPELEEGKSGKEEGCLGQGLRIGDLTRQGERHGGGQVGVDDGLDVGSGAVDGAMDRKVGGRHWRRIPS